MNELLHVVEMILSLEQWAFRHRHKKTSYVSNYVFLTLLHE